MVSIDKLPLITVDGEEIVDLTQPLFDSSISKDSIKTVVVGETLSGKPHLVSQAAYGSQNHIDLLFAYNGYSNPLTVKGGDVLLVPDLRQLKNSIKRDSKKTNESIKEFNKRIPETDKRRLEFLKEKEGNGDLIKTPNMNETKQQFIVDKGSSKVLLGSDVQLNDAVQISINKIKNNIQDEKR